MHARNAFWHYGVSQLAKIRSCADMQVRLTRQPMNGLRFRLLVIVGLYYIGGALAMDLAALRLFGQEIPNWKVASRLMLGFDIAMYKITMRSPLTWYGGNGLIES